MADLITLSSQIGHALSNHGESRNVGYQPMCDHTKYIDKMANGSKDTFDGYEFKTDWNGSSNPVNTQQVICLLQTTTMACVFGQKTQLVKTEKNVLPAVGQDQLKLYGYLM